jgi:1-phosphatidylinositol-4-phosphate 5-kinase
MHESVY